MQPYWAEFGPLLVVCVLAVISPGPDFALILRQALVQGRRAALLSAAGIGVAMIVHVSYTILGLGLIIAQSLLLFNIIKWAGIAYLLYLGIGALISKDTDAPLPAASPNAQAQDSQNLLKSFLLGFAINLLNPKAVIFFLSIFSSLVAATTPLEIKFTYGLIMASITALWFVLVSLFMTTAPIRRLFMRLTKWISRLSGLVFIGFGLHLIFQQHP